jgi:hypothetical protein
MLAVVDVRRANARGVIERMQRRPMVGLKERVGGKLPQLNMPGELLQVKPLGVPVRSIPQSRESPHLRGIIVVNMPVPAVILFEQLEDGAISIGTHLDIGLTVRGGRVEEVPVGPSLPRHGTKPSSAYGKPQRQSPQHRNVLQRLTTHHQWTTIPDYRAGDLSSSPPIQ